MFISPIRPMMHKASPIRFSASQGHTPNYQGDDEDDYVEDTYTESYPPQPQGNFTFSLSPAIPPHMRNTQTPSPHFMTQSPYYMPHYTATNGHSHLAPSPFALSPHLRPLNNSASPSPRRSLDQPGTSGMGRFWGSGSNSDGSSIPGPPSIHSNNSDWNHLDGPQQFFFQPVEVAPRVTENERVAAQVWEHCQALDEEENGSFYRDSHTKATSGAESIKAHNTAANITMDAVSALETCVAAARQYNISLNSHTGARLLQDETGHHVANALHEFFGNDPNSTTKAVLDTTVDNDEHLFNFKQGACNDSVKTMKQTKNRIYLTQQINLGGSPKLMVIVLNKSKHGGLEMLSVVPHSNSEISAERYYDLNMNTLEDVAQHYPNKVNTLGIS